MYYQATDGSQTNNNLFSSCSISSISGVLSTKSSCFKCKMHTKSNDTGGDAPPHYHVVHISLASS